jgi:hypothetical protein
LKGAFPGKKRGRKAISSGWPWLQVMPYKQKINPVIRAINKILSGLKFFTLKVLARLINYRMFLSEFFIQKFIFPLKQE